MFCFCSFISIVFALRPGWGAGSLLVRCWFPLGSFMVHCWFAGGSLLVRDLFVSGSLLVHCWFTVGSLLVPWLFAVAFQLTYCTFGLYFASIVAASSMMLYFGFAGGQMLVSMMVRSWRAVGSRLVRCWFPLCSLVAFLLTHSNLAAVLQVCWSPVALPLLRANLMMLVSTFVPGWFAAGFRLDLCWFPLWFLVAVLLSRSNVAAVLQMVALLLLFVRCHGTTAGLVRCWFAVASLLLLSS